MSTDKIADMATRIRNAYLAGHKTVSIPHTKLLESIISVMKENSYVKDYVVEKNEKGFKVLKATLNYVDSKPALTNIKRISKPGIRVYSKSTTMKPVLSGYGISILTTSKGVMSADSAKKQNIGGEVLLELY